MNAQNMLVLFDSAIYKVGDRKREMHSLDLTSNVDDLNVLQFVNCIQNIYFDERASETYLRKLKKSAERFKKANVQSSALSFLVKENDELSEKARAAGKRNLIHTTTSDCQTKLSISGISIHKGGKEHKLNNTVVQMRPAVAAKYDRDLL